MCRVEPGDGVTDAVNSILPTFSLAHFRPVRRTNRIVNVNVNVNVTGRVFLRFVFVYVAELAMDCARDRTTHAAAAAIGAAFTLLLLARRRTTYGAAGTTDEQGGDAMVTRPGDEITDERGLECNICRVKLRSSKGLEAHLASECHRQQASVCASTESSRSRHLENVHCNYCNVWLRDAAHYTVHVSGKKHTRAVSTASGRSTLAHDFFQTLKRDAARDAATGKAGNAAYVPGASPAAVPVGVITVDLEKPENAGAICRLLGNFSAEGASLVHVHTPQLPGSEEKQGHLLRSGAMRLAGRNCHEKLARRVLSLEEFVRAIATWPVPLVAVETASGAVDLHGYSFPSHCDIIVGGETRGIHPAILAALRSVDAIVYIPMNGFATSMNVSAAACVALYEHRRQHSGGQER